MNRRLTVLACAAAVMASAVMVGGCGSDDDGSSSGSSTRVACDTIYVEGEIVTAEQVEEGCLLEDGSVLVDNACEQVNGDLVVTFTESDPQLWGLVGQPLQAAVRAVDEDPEYTEAVALC